MNHAPFDPARVKLFLGWICEREAIRKRRASGAPKPWTKDKIFQTTRFCNVRRLDDKVSMWMMQNWYNRDASEQMKLTAAVLGRSLNWPDTLACVMASQRPAKRAAGGFTEWRPDAVAAALQARKAQGEKVFTGAYIINGASGGDKINIVVRQATEAHKMWESILDTSSMRNTSENLGVIKGIGSFMGGQIVADLRHVMPTEGWKDKHIWAPAGPGSTRGMKWLLGTPAEEVQRGMNKDEFDRLLRAAIVLVKDKLPAIFEDRQLEAHDIQNCLCETDKYMRLLTGTGRAKNHYPGV